MTKKNLVLAALIGWGAAGAVEAQTTILNQDLSPSSSWSQAFGIETESVISESVVWTTSLSTDSGLFSVITSSGVPVNVNEITVSSGDPTTFDLGPGSYILSAQYLVGAGEADFNAVATPATPVTMSAPEIDPSSAMAGLTLLGFGVTVLRARGAQRRDG